MEKLKERFEKNSKINLLLFLSSFAIYFLYFHSVFFNLNSILSSITADSLKNYYTFVYHIKNDPDVLNFSGMNYPFGEHIIYTDCQPLLTFVLRLLPFTHNYLIGIMHALIFFSFIISPLILNKILLKLGIDKFSSFFIALAIALLSPQFIKINAGHFALAYGCLIPFSILFTLNCLFEKRKGVFVRLFVFNTLLFLLHPYLGFCLSVFSFLGIVLFDLFNFNKNTFFKNSVMAIGACLAPPVLFKVFMSLTDHHPERTTEPYGAEMMVENLDSILAPVFGPFRKLMEYFFSNRTGHYEGHTYLGFFTILLSFCILIILPFNLKKLRVKKEILALLLASLFFLFIAFGLHLKLLNYFHLHSAALNQFRAVCRFAWIFYFTLPLFIVTLLYHSMQAHLKPQIFTRFTLFFSLFFFFFNMLEAGPYFKLDEIVFWKYRNFFKEGFLNEEEKKVLRNIRDTKPQAILPLPLFHGGSEMYERPGSNNSMIPSMIYSYHSGTPILSVLMSRTSLTETKDLIQLLNSYKKEKPINKLLGTGDFFVLITNDALLPDESRLAPHIRQFAQNDSLKYGYVSRNILLSRKMDPQVMMIRSKEKPGADTNNIIFIPFENRKPFLTANIPDYETIFSLDSHKIRSGSYIVSFHYHYTQNTYRAVASDLIINRNSASTSDWQYNLPVRQLSGFYPGFGVFEYRIDLERSNKYDFMLKGFVEQQFHISNFMLRPENTTVILVSGQDSTYNNFPD